MDIEFVDLPPDRRSPRDGSPEWNEIVAKLAANEGQWAKVKHYPSRSAAASAAGNAKRGIVKAFRAHRWDARSSQTEDGGADLYLKCLGPVES